MKKFTEKRTDPLPARELQPDEYFNPSDHLIYCSRCHTPRQGRYTLQNRVFLPPIRCRCQQELYEQEEAKRKLKEKQMEIQRMKFHLALVTLTQHSLTSFHLTTV